MAETWEVQWRATWEPDPVDHSAMISVFVEQWVRVPPCGRPDGGLSQSLGQRHRSRPRLQSPDSTLDLSSNATGTSTGTSYDLWDEAEQTSAAFC